MMSSRPRVTDSLLHPGKGHSPSYGINEEGGESSEAVNSDAKVSIFHIKERVWTIALFSLIACLGSVVIGMLLGYSTNTLSELSTLQEGGDEKYVIANGTWTASLFGAFGPLGALFGAPVAWPLSDKFGRKPALLLSTIPGLMGWIALSVSNLLPTRKGFLAMLYTGRLLSGFSAGWTVFCVSVYITEISTPNVRGLFGNCNQLFITIGIFLVEVLGFSPKNFLNYTDVSLIAAAIVTIFGFLLLFVKETPPWLYKKGKDLEGNRTLNFLRGPKADIPKEIRGIQSTIADTESFTIVDQLKALRRRSVYLPVILVHVLMVFQQFSGINAAVFYSSQIFKSASVPHSTLVTLFAVGLVQIFATFVSVTLVELLGRKTLLVISGSGMLVSSAGLGIYFYVFESFCDGCLGHSCAHHQLKVCESTGFGGLAIGCVVIFIMSFSLGWGPIPWLMMSELVPLQVRGLASAAATLLNWLLAFTVTLGFNGYATLVSTKFAWWTFSIAMVFSVLFCLFLLPETKGRKLEEIEEHFRRGQVLYNPFSGIMQRIHRRESRQ